MQRWLAADEALLFWLTGAEEGYVFALTRDGFDWHTIPLGSDELSQRVAAVRAGLELEKLQNFSTKPALFDLALGHELYVAPPQTD